MPEPSILDARLAEIDRRLRMIQSGLESVPEAAAAEPIAPVAPEPASAPSAVPAGPAPRPPTPLHAAPRPPESLADRLHELTAAQERLLAATRGLLAQSAPAAVQLDAGPFDDPAALRAFERSLARLPEVDDVAVREYAGQSRALLEVRLRVPTA